MKIGILSDTHNNTDKILKAIEYFQSPAGKFCFACRRFSFVSSAKHFEKLKRRLWQFFGNNDFETCDLCKN
jgi:predicted phosphodiesterase